MQSPIFVSRSKKANASKNKDEISKQWKYYEESDADSKSRLVTGTVSQQLGTEAWQILTEHGDRIDAKRAASCLLKPSATSEVLMLSCRENYYILAVLSNPSPHFDLVAHSISLKSNLLNFQNERTHIKTVELRFDAHKIMSFAKRIFFQCGQLWQKTKSTHLEAELYHVNTETMISAATTLHSVTAKLITEKSEVHSQQADKILIN